MKKILILAALGAASSLAFAQSSVSGSNATGAAFNQGVSMSNYFAGSNIPAFTGAFVQQSGIPKPSANVQITSIAPPPSPKTCADTGVSGGVGGREGLLSFAFGTGAEEGCDTVRDMEIVHWLLSLPEGDTKTILTMRACKKKTIKASFADAGFASKCDTAEQRQQRAEAVLNDRPQVVLSSDPLIRARQLGQ